MPVPRELNTAQFVDHMDDIRILYLADEDFKSLCDDYSTVQISIEKFKETPSKDLQREVEYRHLAVELENEILYYVRNRR